MHAWPLRALYIPCLYTIQVMHPCPCTIQCTNQPLVYNHVPCLTHLVHHLTVPVVSRPAGLALLMECGGGPLLPGDHPATVGVGQPVEPLDLCRTQRRLSGPAAGQQVFGSCKQTVVISIAGGGLQLQVALLRTCSYCFVRPPPLPPPPSSAAKIEAAAAAVLPESSAWTCSLPINGLQACVLSH
eukprot:SAG22_NODE_1817_length_3516_cov_34.397425_3_plen_185_part_00